MNNNVINRYKKLILCILKKLDPPNKPIGRPILYNYDICLKYIFDILTSGLSWNKLSYLIKLNLEPVRKRFNKWIKLNVFSDAYNVL